jgi:two-component sensor histidine kinase
MKKTTLNLRLAFVVAFALFAWFSSPAQHASSSIQFSVSVTDVAMHGGQFSDPPRFVQVDSLGYLWFFSDLSAFRYNGSNSIEIEFQSFFGMGNSREFLRGVYQEPGGNFICHFDDVNSGTPMRDTLCAFNPIELIPGGKESLPKLRPHEVVHGAMRHQEYRECHRMILLDTLKATSRMALARGPCDSLTTAYTSRPEHTLHPLFSHTLTGDYLLEIPYANEMESERSIVHCFQGQCSRTDYPYTFIRSNDVPRKYQNNLLWCDSTGSVLTAFWRHERYPEYAHDPYWIASRNGMLEPDSTQAHDADWSERLNLKFGFRGSEVAYHAESERIWVFHSNRFQLFNRAGELIATADLPVSPQFTTGIHDVFFLNEFEAIVVSSFGILHLKLRPDPFQYTTLEKDSGPANLGCRSIVSWNSDTLLLVTDALGVFALHGNEITPVFEDVGALAGLAVDSNEVYLAQSFELWRYTSLHPGGGQLATPISARLTWHLERGSQGRWYVGHRGFNVIEGGKEMQTSVRSRAHVYDFLERDNLLLVAGGDGVQMFDLRRWEAVPSQELYPELEAIKSVCFALLEARDGSIWISTKSQGLGRWKPQEHTIDWYDFDSGLPSKTVYGALEDSAGYVWASTNDGIIRVHPDRNDVSVFGKEDGLPETEFNRTSFHQHLDGTMHFGALSGVVSFDPAASEFEVKPPIPPVVVDRILQHRRTERSVVDITTEYRKAGAVDLGPFDDFVNLELSVLSYEGTPFQFTYRIAPADQRPDERAPDWSPLPRNVLELSNIPPGRWVLEVRAKSNQSSWLPRTLSIPLTVNIPFYSRPEFQAVALLMLFLITLGAYAIRNRTLARRNKKLQSAIAERTRTLEEALELKDMYLAETHHRVKNNLQIISSLLDLQAAQVEDDRVRTQFNLSKSRIDSINLIHQRLYDHTDKPELEAKPFILELFALIEKIHATAARPLQIELTGADCSLSLKQAVPVGMIFNELITNTIKHTLPHQAETHVHIDVACKAGKFLAFTYNDFGSGLPTDTPLAEMSSLGLRLVSRFVHQLQGTIEIDAEQPSIVRFHFPIESD